MLNNEKQLQNQQENHTFYLHSREISQTIDDVSMHGQWPDSWYIMAASKILGIQINVYFPAVNGETRASQDLNHSFGKSSREISIMWTSTKIPECIASSTNNTEWIPNHFVPVLPVSDWSKISFGKGLYFADRWHLRPYTSLSDILQYTKKFFRNSEESEMGINTAKYGLLNSSNDDQRNPNYVLDLNSDCDKKSR